MNTVARTRLNDIYFDNEFLFHGKLSAVPILKNGSIMKLKPIKINDKKVTLNNTCPFDSLFQLMISTYVDRNLFKTEIDLLASENHFCQLIKTVAEKGISSNTYKQRAEILYPLFERSNAADEWQNECVLLDCAAIIDKTCAQLMNNSYSLIQHYKCGKCAHEQRRVKHVLSISVETLRRHDFDSIFEEEVKFTPARCRLLHCDGKVNTTLATPGINLKFNLKNKHD